MLRGSGDGGGPPECDNQYHSDDDPMVALSTGCVKAKVVDDNIVDASKAVSEALGVPESDRGEMDIYWSDTD
ncbi:hypothetical protein CCACVL1_13733 [Corchorus capsularis]|uniref:Uncharacterized protein n=1 Tax=Corchorus capsularis TaxID=210143 RepID=A0A1R3I9S9_COCAP|nr:hypothetical protein CCACVL1_13733 [Corchorus capsularis]